MIKVISFDIGGTLLRENNDNQKNYNIDALTNLLGIPKEIVRSAYKEVFQKRKGTFEELVNMFCEKLSIKPTKEINDFFQNKFNLPEGTIKNEDLELLKKLRSLGYKIIFFSNNCCLVKKILEDSTKDLVDDIFYSYDLGYTKSDNESYQIIEDKLACEPGEFLHIGDTLKSDYLKPKENGWNAIYFGETDDINVESTTDLKYVLKYVKDKK